MSSLELFPRLLLLLLVASLLGPGVEKLVLFDEDLDPRIDLSLSFDESGATKELADVSIMSFVDSVDPSDELFELDAPFDDWLFLPPKLNGAD